MSKKKDGRSKNGGKRAGAGRPRKDSALYDHDSLFANRVLEEEVVVLELAYSRARWKKRKRFDVLLNFYARNGLILKKGYRRDFNDFVRLALETPIPEIYEYRKDRIEYEVHQVKRELEKLREEKKPKEKDMATIEYEEAQARDAERKKLANQQWAGTSNATERYFRNRAKTRGEINPYDNPEEYR